MLSLVVLLVVLTDSSTFKSLQVILEIDRRSKVRVRTNKNLLLTSQVQGTGEGKVVASCGIGKFPIRVVQRGLYSEAYRDVFSKVS